MTDLQPAVDLAERSLLIVEDDKSFLQRLARAMEARGFQVTTAEEGRRRLQQVDRMPPAFAVVDMRLADGNGLDVISALKHRRPDARAIILTGYGNIATAVNAVKIGAVDYLSKPADADDVVAALLAIEGRKVEPPEHPMSADRVRWEHIQRIYELCGRVMSRRPRAADLNMHGARCNASSPSARRAELLLNQSADALDDRFRRGVDLVDQRREMLASSGSRSNLLRLTSAMNSGSFIVALNASRSIFNRSGGRSGGATKGRPMSWPA